MWCRICEVPLVLMVIVNLVSCNTASRRAASPQPESEQQIGEGIKQLYMEASAAAPRSPAQQKLIVKMAEKASNGKELLLVMRAAEGVFPDGTSGVQQAVAKKVMHAATLDQMVEFAKKYPVDASQGRMYVERMFELAEASRDPGAWHGVRVTASRLKLSDLEAQAQARREELASR